MLDAGSVAIEEGGAEAPSHYNPSEPTAALTGKLPNPNVKRFNRKMIALLAVVFGTVIALAFAVGLQAPKKKAAEPVAATAKPPVPNERVNALPDISTGVVALGEPRPGDVGVITPSGTAPQLPAMEEAGGAGHGLSATQQYAEQVRIEHLRNAERARTASVSFASTGANDAPTASDNAGAGSMQGLQDRLLSLAERSGQPPPAAAGSYAERDDQNRQEEKTAFAEKRRASEFELGATLQKPRSPYTLFAGTSCHAS